MNPQQIRREVDRATKACWLALPSPNDPDITPTRLRDAMAAFSSALTQLRGYAYDLRDVELLRTVHTLSEEANLIFRVHASNVKTPLVTA